MSYNLDHFQILSMKEKSSYQENNICPLCGIETHLLCYFEECNHHLCTDCLDYSYDSYNFNNNNKNEENKELFICYDKNCGKKVYNIKYE